MVAQDRVRMLWRRSGEIPCLSAAVRASPWWEEHRAVISNGVAPFGRVFPGRRDSSSTLLVLRAGRLLDVSHGLNTIQYWFVC